MRGLVVWTNVVLTEHAGRSVFALAHTPALVYLSTRDMGVTREGL